VLRAIFFDLDDTLIDRAAAFSRAADALCERFPQIDHARLMAIDERGHAPRLHVANVLVEEFDLPIPAGALRDDLIVSVVAHTVAVAGAADLLRELSASHKTAIVTNGGTKTQRAKLMRAGLEGIAGAVFVSAEVGVEKPHAEMFTRALAWAGCSAAEALHVGDDPVRDIDGAAKAGLATAWIAHGRDWPDELPAPTHTLDKLAALREKILQK
jgi:putative hydrolase of the HAD superfamily